MQRNNEPWLGDLKIAASFVRAIRTGRADLDFELQELADRIERVAALQSEKNEQSTIDQKGRDAA